MRAQRICFSVSFHLERQQALILINNISVDSLLTLVLHGIIKEISKIDYILIYKHEVRIHI